MLSATEAFYAAAAAADLVGAAEQRHDFARSRLELGTVTRSDVLRAEMELGDAELGVLEAEVGLRAANLAGA